MNGASTAPFYYKREFGMGETRLNKYLSEIGYCSRRKADRLIEEGRVRVEGIVASVGQKVLEEQEIAIDGRIITKKKDDSVLLLVNKPIGIVCTADKREPDNIIDFVGYPNRIYPVGRLDKDSHGLILLTNVGWLHNEITRANGRHEKEYIVRVNRRIGADFIRRMTEGVYLPELSCTTAPATVRKLSEKTFSIILIQGKNRQIRRMCKALDYGVEDLKRIRVMHFKLDGIEEGSYRQATDEEWKLLEETNGGRT